VRVALRPSAKGVTASTMNHYYDGSVVEESTSPAE